MLLCSFDVRSYGCMSSCEIRMSGGLRDMRVFGLRDVGFW